MTVKKGDTATLQCDVNGDKPITVSWSKNGNELIPRNNYRWEDIFFKGMIKGSQECS